MQPTPSQINNRERLGNIVKARTDTPLREELRDGQGSYCFIGLCFEALRINQPEKYKWVGGSFIPIGGELDIPRSSQTANKALYEWLGVSEFTIWNMAVPNDEEGATWDKLWEEFERRIKWGV